VAAACLLIAGCRTIPPPPYPLAFGLEVRSPRLLESSSEIAVPVALVNTGSRAWDPAAMHLSYHWLWIVPRETATRSRWNVPFQNGIRTELGSVVTPGQRVAAQGRVLAPDVPGLYWLQWDMVDEGAVWFAQVAPRQPRTLVIVYPPLVWLLAPLPLVAALLGLRRRPRDGRSAAAADVWWCAAVLFAKPFVVIHEALLEPTALAYWLLLACALIPPALALLLPRRLRAVLLFAVGAFASVLILGDVVYYRFFGDVMSAPAVLGAHQTGHVWGSIRSLFSPGLVWLLVDLPFAFVLTLRLSRRAADAGEPPLRRRAQIAAAAVGGLALAGIPMAVPHAAMRLDQMFRDRAVMEQLGPFGFHVYDTWNYARSTLWRPAATPAQMQEARAWFASRAPMRAAGDAFGAARGRNLIVVQVESLQDFVVDFRVGDQEVMPHLRRWSDDSIRFTGVTDETSEGRTSDAEFATMTSLLPLDHGAVAFRYPGNHYVALPRLLKDRGYSTLSAVSFERGFWNRGVMHPSYGFERSLFEPDFQMTEQIGWGLNDRDFLQQMVPRLEQLKRPFAAWMITLSLHHPFEDFPQAHKELQLGALEGTPLGNYLHTMRFFDHALDDLRSALARDGLLDDSVIVVFGDHDAGFARDEAISRAIGIHGDAVSWALNDRIPWFVRVPGGPGGADKNLHGVRGLPAAQTDFAPTLLALLGVDSSALPYVGRNLLAAPADAPIPRPYGDWIDSRRLVLLSGGARECVSLPDRRRVDFADCREADEAARREHDISRLVIVSDLQQRLRDDLARP